MDPPADPTSLPTNNTLKRPSSMSQTSEHSHTASDFIASQLRLEADAREALPYQFDTCTKPLGPLRQSVFACLTCTPPPASKYQQFTPAGVCYSCSISCHGEHNLVELFTKRDFECDCGTTRMGNGGTACSLRVDAGTGRKGGVTGEQAREGNRYNQNYEGKFCGCCDEYDPELERGTMFQCLGLGTVEQGGCGEDWWHPECLMGLPRQQHAPVQKEEMNGALETVKEDAEGVDGTAPTNGEVEHQAPDELPLPTGFPAEDDFDHLICYKCVNAFPWIKQYAGTEGFLPAVSADGSMSAVNSPASTTLFSEQSAENRKRKAEDELMEDEMMEARDSKKVKAAQDSKASIPQAEPHTNGHEATPQTLSAPENQIASYHSTLPPAPSGNTTLFLTETFRSHLCRCPSCFPQLAKHPQLLEEETSYEPPISDSDAGDNHSATGRSAGSGSILERGEAALSSMDRVKAIEGVMAYNHMRDKVKAFLQPFAESGQAVGAEDVKAYFAKLRGDEAAMREAAVGASGTEGGGEGGDGRREQGGY